jgi:ferredoxin-fold anticodon binding domain-containing protein
MNIQELQYFVGKVCTIHTDSLSQNLDPKQMFTYFTGYIKSIDQYSVIIERIAGGRFLTFVKMSNVVAITEEEVEELHPENPEDAKIIDAIKSKNSQPAPLPQAKTPETQLPEMGQFIDPESLMKASKIIKDAASQ